MDWKEITETSAPHSPAPALAMVGAAAGASMRDRGGSVHGSKWGVAIPAALATVASFALMNHLITVEFEMPAPKEEWILEPITPQLAETISEPNRRDRPKPLPAADMPPPPPELSSSKSDIDLPAPIIQGKAPTEVDLGSLDTVFVEPVVINERDAQPVSPPTPVYPTRAAQQGIEGSCEVRFDVSVRGEPFNVQAVCTDTVFARSAEQAVSRVRFAPKIVRGQAAERRNVVYPIQYNLDG